MFFLFNEPFFINSVHNFTPFAPHDENEILLQNKPAIVLR